jgi:YD repeat-containing protein
MNSAAALPLPSPFFLRLNPAAVGLSENKTKLYAAHVWASRNLLEETSSDRPKNRFTATSGFSCKHAATCHARPMSMIRRDDQKGNTVTMNYDNYGRLKDESLTIAARTYTVTRAYDNRSRLTQLTYPNGSIVQRTYTTRSQLHTVRYLGTTVDTRTY